MEGSGTELAVGRRRIALGRWTQAKKLGGSVDVDIDTTTVKDIVNQGILAGACSCVKWGVWLSSFLTVTGPTDCQARTEEEGDEDIGNVLEQAVQQIETSRGDGR
ncbi:hypothetical protein LX32DRAFT_602578 [Colletotrichum zoysiae]|uniref:Uncharacterized protein n=1 Tax=Colletotrichum zoysiae TaxID=1216348 RepID=A0AAD9LY50_9PEZI|nr:hypothetical protein LX32DRAFT_602578 [Colletotrichum zoysiae]